MNFFDTVASNVTKAVDFVVEKNRKTALINRIRIVIKNERENESRAYVALGKYYYENLRDPLNEETEHLCRAIDFSDKRMRKAFEKLDEITAPEGCDEDCADCSYDCGTTGTDPEEEDFGDDFVPPVSRIVERANENTDFVPAGAFADEIPEEAADDEPIPPVL